ncbi:hypothetical protein [Spirosoma sp. KNUC1025]|uniref:hypothetical protein n=1 Tax=Spirosoma sp. KNUC1025 TaxID=2894082 RepID=UPI00386BF812|nr:hypothetical protein LN737_00075 [Spirosoma sp. KNUC1025]
MKSFYLFLLVNFISFVSFGQCHELYRKADKLGDITTVTTLSPDQLSTESVHYKRVKEKGKVQYFLMLSTEAGTSHPQKGAAVVFKDGSKVEWTDALVEFSLKNGHYTSYCEIKLAEDIVDYFRDKEIAFIQLSSHKGALDLAQSQRAKTLINCIIFSDLIDIKSDQVVSQ